MMCREFDSLMDRHSLLTQLVEYLFYMQDVVGSNPTETTYYARWTSGLSRFPFTEKIMGSNPIRVTIRFCSLVGKTLDL